MLQQRKRLNDAVETANILMTNGILGQLPRDEIIAAFERSPENEILSGKLANPQSSAAQAANTFGWFLRDHAVLRPLPNTADFVWPALTVTHKECARFP